MSVCWCAQLSTPFLFYFCTKNPANDVIRISSESDNAVNTLRKVKVFGLRKEKALLAVTVKDLMSSFSKLLPGLRSDTHPRLSPLNHSLTYSSNGSVVSLIILVACRLLKEHSSKKMLLLSDILVPLL